jgi:hypothetical protein
VVEVAEGALVVDGVKLSTQGLDQRAAALRAWVRARPPATAAESVLYVAASRDTDVKTLRTLLGAVPENVELRLLVGTVQPYKAGAGQAGRAAELAGRLLAERNPALRREIAEEGYREFSECAAFARTVANAASLDAHSRWPGLRRGLVEALPSCGCAELDTRSLEPLLLAEQRAGASTLGVLPLDFLRDPRCGASMPLRSIGKLVAQMENFDREFAGQFRGDAVEFNDVLASERLLTYFCDALPGETLAAEQRQRATLYLRRDADSCEAWRFEPLSPGAPMGTWRRASGTTALAVHYWQAAEEIRLFGPVSALGSKPTDRGEWACDQSLKLVGVDARSIQLEATRWFFDARSCESAPAEQRTRATGCFATLGAEPSSDDPK